MLKAIAKSLKEVDSGLASRFNEEVRVKISTHSSFKDRFDHVKAMLDDLGTPVRLEHTALSKARSAYRHDVVALKSEHFEAMRAGIGLAWFLGLVWLCQEIGVPKNVLQESARRDLFHVARWTALPLWGKRPAA